MLKYWKLNQIKSLKSDEDEENKNIENNNKLQDNELEEEENKFKKNENIANLIKSEERWKLK